MQARRRLPCSSDAAATISVSEEASERRTPLNGALACLDIFADNEDQYEIKRKVLAKPRRDAQQAGAINATGTRREDEEHAGGSQDDEDDEAA